MAKSKGKPGGTQVVGHSWGSHLVLQLAAAHDVTAIVLIGAAKSFPEGLPIFYLPVFVLRWLQPSLTQAFLRMALCSTDPELWAQETEACNANPMYMCPGHQWRFRYVYLLIYLILNMKYDVIDINGDSD